MIVLRNQVPEAATMKTLDFLMDGEYHDQMQVEDVTVFDAVRYDPRVMQLLAYLPAQQGELCDPQVVLHWPDDPAIEDRPWDPHLDIPPPWADGRQFSAILGVALTEQNYVNGGVRFATLPYYTTPPLHRGDVVAFGPWDAHCPGTNRSRALRASVYFRFLERT